MKCDLAGITDRAAAALRAIQTGSPSQVQCERFLTHDLASLIEEVQYLRRCNKHLTGCETEYIAKPHNEDHG